MAFRAMKSAGFHIEDTHLIHIDRLEKLLALVSIAFCWAYLAGIYLHQNKRKIRILNNGRKAKSISKQGLNFFATTLLNTKRKTEINIFRFLSCTCPKTTKFLNIWGINKPKIDIEYKICYIFVITKRH